MKILQLFAPAVALAATLPGFAQAVPPHPAPAEDHDTYYLDVFTVKSDKSYGYKATNSTSGTRVATSLKDIPQDIAVLTRDFLVDQQAFKLEDAFNYTAGVQRTAFNGNFNVRGFTVGPPLRDGAIGTTVTDTSMIDRVEVVRGPAAALYGRSTPGGVINIITRKPSATPAYSLLTSYARYDVKRVEGSATGPLDAGKTLLYRVDAAYQDGDTFRWFEHQETTAITPTLAWRPREGTLLSLNYSFINSNYQSPPSVMPLDSTQSYFVPGVDWSFNKKEPDAFRDTQDSAWTFELQQKLGDHLSFRSINRYIDFTAREVNITGFALAPNTTHINRVFQRIPTGSEKWVTQNDFVARFETGAVKHTILLGMDFTKVDFENYRYTQAIAPLDVFHPVYGSEPTGAVTTAFGTLSTDNYGGGYLFGQSQFGENLTLSGGLRYDVYRTRSFNRVAKNARTDSNGEKASPQIGATYPLFPGVSVYALYSKSYVPNPGVNPDGSQFKPTQGEAKELGMKTDLLDGRLSSTVAVYDIVQDNSLVNDRNRPGFNIPLGEYLSRGVDFDLLWQIRNNWALIGAYSYIDAYTSNDSNPARIGVQGTDVAHNRWSAWTKYTFARGAAKGLELGFGAIYVDKRLSGLGANNAVMPAYHRYDASASYGFDFSGRRCRVSLNLRNLTNKHYYEYGGEPGAPFTYVLSLRTDF